MMITRIHPYIFLVLCFSFIRFCHGVNTITSGQTIKDGESLISNGEKFELGFFSPGNSSLRFVGVWYHNLPIQTVIWVANRNRPVSDKSGVLRIGEDGNLKVLDGNGNQVWSSNVSIGSSNTTVAVLTDSGNLILSSNESVDDIDRAFWQSFEHPTDTFLPDMRVYLDSPTGENSAFSSWRSPNDPSPGNFSTGIDAAGSPQIVLWEGSKRLWRSGQWNGILFTGISNMTNFYLYGFKLAPGGNDGSNYFTYVPANASSFVRFYVRWDGKDEQLKWDDSKNEWSVLQLFPGSDCEKYNFCGDFGICNDADPVKCQCMDGFVPKNDRQWKTGNWSDGCVRKTDLKCQSNISQSGDINGQDGFKSISCGKLPDQEQIITNADSDSCKERCLDNCSCNAYAFVSGIGCMIWTRELKDVQHFDKDVNLFHLRLADSDLSDGNILPTPWIIVIVIVSALSLVLIIWLLCRLGTKAKDLSKSTSTKSFKKSLIPVYDPNRSREYSSEVSGPAIEGSQVDAPELPLFNFSCIATATSNFSRENKLGRGGFGTVYKGMLPGGEKIAVKRLSKVSGQGLEEFKNEIILIAKLQHRNLVRLLGCCIQEDEKMLIYEYMSNKSLDCFLFDPEMQKLLDWGKRFAIIEGIARGLLYLHRDSRLRIIHRDLKASNILLDDDMNPKISDFGMARIFGGNQNEANTNRVVGTYGYMAPEYAMEGLFSFKSDVYSFGVLLLEIVCGRRNTSFRVTDHSSLVGYAWDLWNAGRAMELVDASIRESCNQNEVLRSIHIGILCVQDSSMFRPSMASVVLMLESEAAPIPDPRQPTFTSIRNSSVDMDVCSEGQEIMSCNDITVTMVVAR